MFNKSEISFDKIIRMIISSIIKRKILGISYGAAIISEGVFHFMTDEEIKSTEINFTYDDHGHPELGNVSKAHIFNLLLQRRLKEMNISVKSRPEELGYELRCVNPSGFDLMYCSLLGIGVKMLYDEGYSGCMVTSDPKGDVFPLFLKDVTDENGKVKPRLVNINSQKARLVYEHNLQFLGKEDYEEARKYLPDPENYDFLKILNW
jgi:6-phosphofructokinase 1